MNYAKLASSIDLKLSIKDRIPPIKISLIQQNTSISQVDLLYIFYSLFIHHKVTIYR